MKRVDGAYESSISSGGLVTALSGLTKSTQFRWFGWPGIEVKDIEDRKQVSQCLAEHNANPVFLDSDLAHEHYNGFSSKFLQHGDYQATLADQIIRPDLMADPPLPVWSDIR